MILPFTVTAENCQHPQFPEILGTNFQVAATIPEKRLGKCASERFTPENIVYTQLYIDYLKDKDPSSVKFFDESGFELPDAGHRHFGFSPVGEDCVEARRYLSTANLTLNFLVGYDGVKYGNIIQGASNSVQFLRLR